MLRVAVFSDTHANLNSLPAVKAELGSVDWLIHAGDHLADMPAVARSLGVDPQHCRGVLGNCDYHTTGPQEEILDLTGVRILLTHGHRYGVKAGLQRLFYRTKELNVQVAVFGHTHVAINSAIDTVLLFNPGSLSEPRLPGHPPSCGILEVNEGLVRARHIFAPLAC